MTQPTTLARISEAMKALVAAEHARLIAAWNMLTNGEFYRDPGADYFTRRIPTKTKERAIGQLEALCWDVAETVELRGRTESTQLARPVNLATADDVDPPT